MINDDTIIKIERLRGFKRTWPEQTNRVKSRLQWVREGFPGIRNDHLDLTTYARIKTGSLYIWDPYLEKGFGFGDEAPLMLKDLGNGKSEVIGIGKGSDSKRDPTRTLIRWKDIIPTPIIAPSELVLRVNPKPTLNGGSAYYYFYKSPRDQRD
ncbi:MAG: hypothetical protein J6I84_02895 [Bacilli bacterium]|nr:hypothetical protein [Bacilli bacterium]